MGDRFVDLIPGKMSGGGLVAYIPTPEIWMDPSTRVADGDNLLNTGSTGSLHDAAPVGLSPVVNIGGKIAADISYGASTGRRFIGVNANTGIPGGDPGDVAMAYCCWIRMHANGDVYLPFLGANSGSFLVCFRILATTVRATYLNAAGAQVFLESSLTVGGTEWLFMEMRYSAGGDVAMTVSRNSFADLVDATGSPGQRRLVDNTTWEIYAPYADAGFGTASYLGEWGTWCRDAPNRMGMEAIFNGQSPV